MTPSAAGSGAGEPDAISATEWHRAVTLIQEADEVCLACHVSPDGDALGSMLGLAQALRTLGKRFVASFGDLPFSVPAILRFLPGLELLCEPTDYPSAPEVMITFDVGNPERLGLLAANAAKAQELIVIDHHMSNTRFGTLNLLEPRAAATAVIVEELIRRLRVPLTPEIATVLYAGLATDTGSFRFSSTTPGVHLLAARLVDAGVRPDVVSRELWDNAPFGYLRVLAAALGRANLEPDAAGGHGLVWTVVTRADRSAHGLSLDLVEAVIDVVRRTEEADVAVVLKEDDAGEWRVSARSKGGVDVGRVCVELGGGGHASAAGFTARGEVGSIIARLRELLAQSVRSASSSR